MAGLLVVALDSLTAAAGREATLYPVRLGPLRFTCLVGEIPETLGDKLDTVGASLVLGERAPRPVTITLPVNGSYGEVDDRPAGMRLRRQVRALLNNAAWRPHGLYFEAGWDPETAMWLAVSGGQLGDEGRGFPFGDWQLALTDAYLLGRTATHRRGRRITIVDRAAPGIPHDTRRLLTSTDLAGPADPVPPIAIPGDVVAVTGYRDREPTLTAGPTIDGRKLWQTLAPAGDAELVSWRPNRDVLTDRREREADAEDPGSVRVWATSPDPWTTTADGDRHPDLRYGWERVLGDVDDQDAALAIDNGWCRVRWLGGGRAGGLLLERAPADLTGPMIPTARVLHRAGFAEVRAVEITAERAVLVWRTGGYELRAELRRGWAGPRLEAYAPGGDTATLAIAAPAGTSTAIGTLVDRIPTADTAIVAAKSHAAIAWTSAGDTLDGQTGRWTAPRVLVVQTDLRDAPAAEVRALARWDVRATPTLTEA